MRVKKLGLVASCIVLTLLINLLCVQGVAYGSGIIELPMNQTPEVISQFVNIVDAGDYSSLLDLFVEAEHEEMIDFLNDTENQTNHIGYYNFNSAMLVSCNELGADEMCGLIEEEYESMAYWECFIAASRYRESDYLDEGLNRYIFILTTDPGEQKIVRIVRDATYIADVETNLLANDSPIAKSDNSSTWSNPSTIRVMDYGTVNFLQYCQKSLDEEFGYSTSNAEARKAVALAIKNYAWHFILAQQFSGYEYDIRDQDQSYDPNETVHSYTTTAVNAIWNYVILSYDYELIRAFHTQRYVEGERVASYAVQGGGVISQEEANDLGNGGMGWQDIVHYFYDRGTIKPETSNGPVRIVNMTHSMSSSGVRESDLYGHWYICNICQCGHGRESHSWSYISSLRKYRCSVCSYTSATIPATPNWVQFVDK